jgi:hypothetical protein
MGSRINLNQILSIAPGITARSAYSVGILGPQGNPSQPNFFLQPIEAWPYLYIPVPDLVPGETLRVFYRNPAGVSQELNLMNSFSEDPEDEFIIVGNCAVAFINNPGIFYTQ